MKTVTVNLGRRKYLILIGANIISALPVYLKKLKLGNDAFIITNPLVRKVAGLQIIKTLAAAGFRVKIETIPDTEKSKSEPVAFKLINKIAAFAKSKQPFIIALGGGVVGDLAGFVASIYKRGIPYIQAPTTLLAQIDSSIGGKVGIDLGSVKNLVGAFYQPRLVLCDIGFLKTLPRKQIISGLAEAIKYALIKDKNLFAYIENNYQRIIKCDTKSLEHIINRCVRIKAQIVAQDEKETKGIRTVLNFGHTIGHAIEAAGEFKTYSHGEAIAMGMLAAAEISRSMRILVSNETPRRIKNLLLKLGLPVKAKGVKLEKILHAQSFDKKFIHGKNRLVLLKQIGHTVIKEGIPREIIRAAIKEIL